MTKTTLNTSTMLSTGIVIYDIEIYLYFGACHL